MNLKLENLSTKYPNLKVEDGLYLPNFEKNIYKLRDTFENLLEIKNTKDSLLKYNDIKSLINNHDCFQPKNIIHFTIDSLGINQLIEKNYFLNLYRKNNEIIELSSLFPSITSTILTSIHLGIPPEGHGVLGHKIFFPELGSIVNTLTMSIPNAKDDSKDAIIKSGINPKALLWKYVPTSAYESEKYKQYNLLQFDIAMTGLSHLMLDARNAISFRNYIDGFEKIKLLLKRKEKLYIHFYIGDLDDISHAYGPFSSQFEEISVLIDFIFKNFIKSIDSSIAKETVMTITADHGQNTLHDDKRIIFNEEDINKYKKYSRAPMGKSGRVLHFYAKEDKIDELKELIEEKTKNSALILTKKDDFSPLFATENNKEKIFQRLGNIVVIFKPNYSAEKHHTSKEDEAIKFIMHGSHGSLSLDELKIPLFIDKIENYQKSI
ncbi:MAG: alkaline phosphatase family protein [Candidatus Helarchaeota archaeon]